MKPTDRYTKFREKVPPKLKQAQMYTMSMWESPPPSVLKYLNEQTM